MPTYDYKCKTCGHRWEGVAKMNDPCPPCVQCGLESQKVFGAAPIHFHGSGWAKDGYENKQVNGLLKKHGMDQ
jgi:hypothetical protein